MPGFYSYHILCLLASACNSSLKNDYPKDYLENICLHFLPQFHPIQYLPCKPLLSEILKHTFAEYKTFSDLFTVIPYLDQITIPPVLFWLILFEFSFSQSYPAQFCAFFLLPFFFFLLLVFASPFLQTCL